MQNCLDNEILKCIEPIIKPPLSIKFIWNQIYSNFVSKPNKRNIKAYIKSLLNYNF